MPKLKQMRYAGLTIVSFCDPNEKEQRLGWGAANFGEAKIGPEQIQALFGGSYPYAEGFAWDLVTHFRVTSSDTIQGFGDDDEPIGPIIKCHLRVLPP